MHKLIIEVGVEKSETYKFNGSGFVYTGCPICGHDIEFILNGLEEDPTITPVINWEAHETELSTVSKVTESGYNSHKQCDNSVI